VLLIEDAAGDKMPRPRVSSNLTTNQVAKQLGMKVGQLISWVEHGALPPPTIIDSNGVRYFDREWLSKATEIVKIRKSGR